MSQKDAGGRSSQVSATASPAAGSRSTNSSSSKTVLKDWTPQDDGIDAGTLSKEDTLPYINNVLYGPRTKKRLPVFTAICPDEDIPSTTGSDSTSTNPPSFASKK